MIEHNKKFICWYAYSLVGRTIVGVETFAVSDERELSSVGLLLSEIEDEKSII